MIQHVAGGQGWMLFIPFVKPDLRTRMLTAEPEALAKLMHSVRVMLASVVEMGQEKEREKVEKRKREHEGVVTVEETYKKKEKEKEKEDKEEEKEEVKEAQEKENVKEKEKEGKEGETVNHAEDGKKEGDTHMEEDGDAVPKLLNGIGYCCPLSREERDVLGSPSPEPKEESEIVEPTPDIIRAPSTAYISQSPSR